MALCNQAWSALLHRWSILRTPAMPMGAVKGTGTGHPEGAISSRRTRATSCTTCLPSGSKGKEEEEIPSRQYQQSRRAFPISAHIRQLMVCLGSIPQASATDSRKGIVPEDPHRKSRNIGRLELVFEIFSNGYERRIPEYVEPRCTERSNLM